MSHKLTEEQLKTIKYLNIKNKTSYSIMTAIGVVNQHINKCKEAGHAGICITESGHMMSALDLYNKTKNGDFPSVLGASLNLIENTDIKSRSLKTNAITILVKDFEGWKNACYVTSIGSIDEKFYSIPRISFEDLEENKDGLMVTCGGFHGMISEAIQKDQGFLKDIIINEVLDNEELIKYLNRKKKYSIDFISEIVEFTNIDEGSVEEKVFREFLNDEINFLLLKELVKENSEENLKEILIKNKDEFPIKKGVINNILEKEYLIFEDEQKTTTKRVKKIKKDLRIAFAKLLFDTSAEKITKYFVDMYKDDFYFELSFYPQDKQWNRDLGEHEELMIDPNEKVIIEKKKLAEKFNIKILAVQDSYMPDEDNHVLQSIMLWNRPGSKDGFYFPEPQFIKSLPEFYEQVVESYGSIVSDENFLEWTNNTQELIEKSKDLEIAFRPSLPNLDYEEHYVNKVPVVIQRSLMNALQDLGFWNEDIKARIKENKSIQDEDLPEHIKEKYDTEDKCINFAEMKEREKENVFFEETLIKMEKYYKESNPKFSKLISKSKKDLELRTALKVMMRNKKLVPKILNEEKMQALIDKNPKTKGKKIKDFDPMMIKRVAAKHNFYLKSDDPMLLLGDKVIQDRLALEMNTIQHNGVLKLVTYFMLLEDVSNFVKENGYLRGFGRGCLTGDALVLTRDHGYQRLDAIVEKEDFVYTSTGEVKQVLKTFKYNIEEELVEIKTSNNIENIKMTLDHKVYGVKRKLTDEYKRRRSPKIKKYEKFSQDDLVWDEIQNFQKGDLLFFPKPQRKVEDIQYINFSNYCPSKHKLNIKNNVCYYSDQLIINKVNLDKEFCYFIGKWVGDGSVRFCEEKRRYSISFAFNSDETKEIEKTKSFFKNKLGLKIYEYKAKNKKLITLTIHSYPLAKFFKELFPNYKNKSNTKYFGTLKYLPENKLRSLMNGYISADGSIEHYNESITTTSKQLALDFVESLQSLNIPFSWTTRDEHFHLNNSNYLCKESYKIKFRGFNVPIRDKSLICSDGYFVKIKDLVVKEEKTAVYDLMIEDNPSYITSNFVVHNSGAGSIAAYSLDITDCEPLEYELLFERFLTEERISEVFVDLEGFDLNKFKEENEQEVYDEEKIMEELNSLIIKERDSQELEEFKKIEQFYMECKPVVAMYYIDAYKKLKGKKIKNINSSTIAYLIGITDEKPVKIINSTDTALPDIDYDTNARDEVKEYLVKKFGVEKVTLMGTFNTLKTKGAIKDILRQLSDMSFKEINELTRGFDNLKRTNYKSEHDYFHAAIEGEDAVKEIQDYFRMHEDIKKYVDDILLNVRGTGIHAGGIVVAGDDVTRIVPCTFDRKEKMWVTQPDMNYVEWAGLIKYDFLGLNTLNDINNAFRLIERRYNKVLSFDQIPLNDPVVMRMFKDGETMSVFQFGTFLAHSIITQLKEVRNISDLAIITSIARPGPLNMAMDKSFIKRVNKDEPVTYIHPSLESILEDTYGITCYQEQIMLTAQKLAHYDGNESQNLMKAMSKKKADKVAKHKKIFLENSIKEEPTLGEIIDFQHPVTEEVMKISKAEAIFLFCESFAEYGFNKSHAIAYSTVSYICMWLKKYFKIEWITGVLSGATKDDFKEFYAEWHDYILKPDINKSKKDYVISKVKVENDNGEMEEKEKTIMPFSFIENVGASAVEEIVQHQPYTSFIDFCEKVNHRKITKKVAHHLILSGTFDSLRGSKAVTDYRKKLMKDYYDFKRGKTKNNKFSAKEEIEVKVFLEEIESMSRGDFLIREVALLNLTAFDYHSFYKKAMTLGARKEFGREAITPDQVYKLRNGEEVVVGGAIENKVLRAIKNGKNRGKEMAFFNIINKDSKVKVTVFSNYLEGQDNPIKDAEDYTPIIIKGKVQIDPKWGTSIIYQKSWILKN